MSFLLGALLYFLFLSYSGVAGGKFIILQGDGMAQNIAGLKCFIDNLKSGKGFIYSWSSFLGFNSYLNLANGMMFSITVPLYYLFNDFDFSVITVISVIIKAGLASLSFYIYMEHVWRAEGLKTIIFSAFYSLCAFQVSYVTQLYYYEDAVFMLPVILYLVTDYVDSGRFRLLCLAYCYQFLNVFYIGYIVGFFSLLYMLFYMKFIKKLNIKEYVRKLLFFGICVLISAGICAVIIYPMAYFILTGYLTDDIAEGTKGTIHLFDVYDQLFIGQNKGVYSECPYIYCGLPALLLFPLYFSNKKIQKSERILWGLLLLLMISSCFIKPLYLFWHCFDFPDGFYFRFSFIISFILCVTACRQSGFLYDMKTHLIIAVGIINIIIYFTGIFIQPLYFDKYKDYPVNTFLYGIINAVFIIMYLIFTIFYKRKKEKYDLCLGLIIIILAASETVLNGYSSYYKEDRFNPENYYDTYKLWDQTTRKAVDLIKENDDGFYRVSCRQDYSLYGGAYFGYNGISGFSSFENKALSDVLEKLGVYTSPRIVLCEGLSDFTKMIFSVGYELKSIDFGFRRQYPQGYEPDIELIKNEYCLSVGFLVDEEVEDYVFRGRNSFENINGLLTCMTGIKDDAYSIVNSGLGYEEYGIRLVNEDGIYKLKLSENRNYGLIELKIPIDERPAFFQYDYGLSVHEKKAPYISDGISGAINDYKRISTSYIELMTELGDVYETVIYMNENTFNEVPAPNMYFSYYNKNVVEDAYEVLKKDQMEIEEYGNGYIYGKISNNKEGKILFTSIPYDDGWELYVNGIKTDIIKLLEGAFIGAKLPKGECDIMFKYHVPGLKTGAMISLISFICLLILIGLKDNKSFISIISKEMHYEKEDK